MLQAETKPPVTDGMSLTDLIALKHLHAMINGLLQGFADIKNTSDYVTFLSMELKSIGEFDFLTCSFTASKKVSRKLRLI